MSTRMTGFDGGRLETEGDWEAEDMEADLESGDPEGDWEAVLQGEGFVDQEGDWESEDLEAGDPEGDWEAVLEGEGGPRDYELGSDLEAEDLEVGDLEGDLEFEDLEAEDLEGDWEFEDLESEGEDWESEGGDADRESARFYRRARRVPPAQLRRIARAAAASAVRGIARPSYATPRTSSTVRVRYRPSARVPYARGGIAWRPSPPAVRYRTYPTTYRPSRTYPTTYRPGAAYRWPARPTWGTSYPWRYRPGYAGYRWGGRPYGWRYLAYPPPWTRVVRSYAPPVPEPFPVEEPPPFAAEPPPPVPAQPPAAVEPAPVETTPIATGEETGGGPAPAEGEWEGDWESPWSSSGPSAEMFAPDGEMDTEALMEHLGHAAAETESDLEAEAFLGALVPLAAKLAPSILGAVPQLAKGIGAIGRSLRRSKQAKAYVRTLPAALMAAADGVTAMQAETGRPVRPEEAVRALARSTGSLLSSPRASTDAYARSRELDREYHDASRMLHGR
jgi:hypothetical protein